MVFAVIKDPTQAILGFIFVYCFLGNMVHNGEGMEAGGEGVIAGAGSRLDTLHPQSATSSMNSEAKSRGRRTFRKAPPPTAFPNGTTSWTCSNMGAYGKQSNHKNIILSAFVCVFICIQVHVCLQVHMHVQCGRQRSALDVMSQVLSTLFLKLDL